MRSKIMIKSFKSCKIEYDVISNISIIPVWVFVRLGLVDDLYCMGEHYNIRLVPSLC